MVGRAPPIDRPFILMIEEPRLTFQIIRDAGAPTRFRWLIYEGVRAKASSRKSYATRREAEVAVGKAMIKLTVEGRSL